MLVQLLALSHVLVASDLPSTLVGMLLGYMLV